MIPERHSGPVKFDVDAFVSGGVPGAAGTADGAGRAETPAPRRWFVPSRGVFDSHAALTGRGRVRFARHRAFVCCVLFSATRGGLSGRGHFARSLWSARKSNAPVAAFTVSVTQRTPRCTCGVPFTLYTLTQLCGWFLCAQSRLYCHCSSRKTMFPRF